MTRLRSCFLNIAGYKIRIESSPEGPDLVPSERFNSFLTNINASDIHIRVNEGNMTLPPDSVKVFEAPYVEEINGVPVRKNDKFWSIYKNGDALFIRTGFPLSPGNKNGTLKFSLESGEWELWIENAGGVVDPLEYPLDGLLLYYLTAIHKDIMIHASGVYTNGKGYLFSGVSGKGKTTMAKLWDNNGARVIHDDRLIIRKTGGKYIMYNTPVYKNDEPREALLSRLFLIEHGQGNELIDLNGASSVTRVMANCIQHNWNSQIVSNLVDSVSGICSTIPIAKLYFRPDRSIIDFILDNE